MDERMTYGISEVAHALGVSPDSVRRSIRDGELRAIRFRDRVLVPRAELERISGSTENERSAIL